MSTNDGGPAALGGYLYQMVGALGLTAWAHTVKDSSDSPDLNAVIEAVRRGASVHHEQFGEDVDVILRDCGLDKTDDHVFIQFKYAGAGTSSTIGLKELAKIKASYRASRQRAAVAGKSVSRYILITNCRIPTYEQEDQRAQDAGQDPVNRVIDDVPFRIVVKFPEETWISKLEEFGRKFGCLDDDIKSGIAALVGELVLLTRGSNKHSITEGWIAHKFTNIVDPRPLTRHEIALADRDSYSACYDRLGLLKMPVRRVLLSHLSEAARRRALIVVVGPGGSGKSVMLWDWMSDFHFNTEASAATISTMRHVQHVLPSFLGHIAAEWSNDTLFNSGRQLDVPIVVVERLSVANPGSVHPVLHFGLDGLDEPLTSEQAFHARKLVSWFWQEDKLCRAQGRPPRASLVVTCRSLDELEDRLLSLNESGFSIPSGDHPEHLFMAEFTWEELTEAARGSDSHLEQLIDQVAGDTWTVEQELSPVHAAQSGNDSLENWPVPQATGYMSRMGKNPAPTYENFEAVHLLRHPFIWRAFLGLTPGNQRDLLDGSEAARNELADHILTWFSRRTSVRGLPLQPSLIKDALQPLAYFCMTSDKQIFDRADWLDYACVSRVIAHPVNRQLYDEAISSGLITQEAQSRWGWRHRFICSYLAGENSSSVIKAVAHETGDTGHGHR